MLSIVCGRSDKIPATVETAFFHFKVAYLHLHGSSLKNGWRLCPRSCAMICALHVMALSLRCEGGWDVNDFRSCVGSGW